MRGQLTTFVLAVLASSLCPAAELHVSPQGDDRNPGTAAAPFRTIAGAQREARLYTGTVMREAVTVHVHPGVYVLSEPLMFDQRDSGRNGFRVTYRAAAGPGSAVLRGSVPVVGWTKGEDGIWAAPLPGGHVCETLYQDGRRMRKARFPDYEHNPEFPAAATPYLVSVDGSPKQEKEVVESWVQVERETFAVLQVADRRHMKINVFPWGHRNWHRWICSVLRLEPERRRVVFGPDGDGTEIGKDARLFFEGAAAFLDQPGEFFVDREKKQLLCIPYAGDPGATCEVRIPILKDLIRIVGDDRNRPACNLSFDGFRFEETDAISPTRFWWAQDWGFTDHAFVFLRNAQSVELRNLHGRNGGRHAVVMVGAVQANRVENCWFEQLGVNGIVICNRRVGEGNKPPADIAALNQITNCRIHDVGQLSIYASCVAVHNASFNRVQNCELYNSARYAFTMRGNANWQGAPEPGWDARRPPASGNVLSHCYIHHCGQDGGDMGAVHAASVNILDGPRRNTFEQLVIDRSRAVPGMNDWKPNGIFLDWPERAMHQVFRDILITRSEGKPWRTNGTENTDSAVLENVSWQPGFDYARMEFDRIGLTPAFPAAYRGHSPSAPPPPTGLRATPDRHDRVTLIWGAPAEESGRLEYFVYRNGQSLGATRDLTFVDDTVVENTVYTYVLRARHFPAGPPGNASSAAQITAPADRTPPLPLCALLLPDRQTVYVQLSKPVSAASLEAPDSFLIDDNAGIASVTARDGRTAVELRLAAALPTTDDTAQIQTAGLTDLTSSRNRMPKPVRLPLRALAPVLHCRFDEVEDAAFAADLSPARHQLHRRGAAKWAPGRGKYGGALVLGYQNGWLEGPTTLNIGRDDATVMAWILSRGRNNRIIASKGNGFAGENCWSWGWDPTCGDGQIAFRWMNNFATTESGSLQQDEWLHVAFVRRGCEVRMFVNGRPAPEAIELPEGCDLTNGLPFLVGRRPHEPTPSCMVGLIDELRIYPTALTGPEIQLLMRNID